MGSGCCVQAAPDLFSLDRLNRAVPAITTAVQASRLLDVARACPMLAVIVEAVDGARLFPALE